MPLLIPLPHEFARAHTDRWTPDLTAYFPGQPGQASTRR